MARIAGGDDMRAPTTDDEVATTASSAVVVFSASVVVFLFGEERPPTSDGVAIIVGFDDDGQPNGHMVENAVAPFYTRAVEQALARDEAGYMAQLARYQDRLFAAGLTRVYDAAVSPLMATA